MAYQRINFENKPSKKSPISAENLNHMEEGIFDAHVSIAELEAYKANSILSKASGEVITTTDSAKVKPKNIKLFGKGKQRQYDGNQLLNITDGEETNNGITVVRKNGVITINGTPTNTDGYTQFTIGDINAYPQNAYTLSVNNKLVGVGLIVQSASGDLNHTMSENNTVKSKEDTITGGVLTLNVSNANSYSNSVIEYMLNKGTTALPWEPYVGNEPSPSINYPQKAEFLGESGSIETGLGAENYALSDRSFSNEEKGVNRTVYDGEPKIRVQGVITDDTGEFGLEVVGRWEFTNENAKLLKAGTTLYAFPRVIGFDIYDWHNKKTCYFFGETTLEEDLYLDEIFVRFPSGYFPNGIIDETIEFMLTDSLQPFTFQTPNGLRGIPLGQTIPDVIKNSPIHMSGVYWDVEQYQIADTENEDGKDVQRIQRETVTLNRLNYPSTPKGYRYEGHFNGSSLMTSCLCNIALYNAGAGGSTSNNGIRLVPSISLAIIECESDEESITAIIDYILADPIITDTTEEEKAQLDALVMNYPNTTIVNDAGAYMEVEYVCDTKEHIKQNYVSKEAHEEHESRIAELEKAMVNS